MRPHAPDNEHDGAEPTQVEVWGEFLRETGAVITGFTGAPLATGFAYNAYLLGAEAAWARLFALYTLLTTWVSGGSVLLCAGSVLGMLLYGSRVADWLYRRHFKKTVVAVVLLGGGMVCGWLLKLLVVLTHGVPWDHRFSRKDGGVLGWVGGILMHDGDYTRGFRITGMNARYGTPLAGMLVGALAVTSFFRWLFGIYWRRAQRHALIKARAREERLAAMRDRVAAARGEGRPRR